MLNKYHSFHIVENSPWPLLSSLAAISLTSGIILWMHSNSHSVLSVTLLSLSIVSLSWWNNIFFETGTQGAHSNQVTVGLQIGILIFILSEILFFTSFFWAFFHSSMSPAVELGQFWPPHPITPFNPVNIPLLNTLLLLSSGVSITWCHHSLLNNNLSSNVSLMITIILGITFSLLQAFEYAEASFTLSDSVYGTTFFISTGFHGLHVLIGTTFLIISLIRINNINTSHNHLTHFECAAWYWHFVDVVWLFLYLNVYWWGS